MTVPAPALTIHRLGNPLARRNDWLATSGPPSTQAIQAHSLSVALAPDRESTSAERPSGDIPPDSGFRAAVSHSDRRFGLRPSVARRGIGVAPSVTMLRERMAPRYVQGGAR